MAIRRLERNEWRGFCIRASRYFLGKQVEIEVLSMEIGAQLEARRLPLIGLEYDAKNDVLELLAGELDHLVRAPRELYVDEGEIDVVTLQIVDADGVRQIVTMRDPLMLPDPRYLLR